MTYWKYIAALLLLVAIPQSALARPEASPTQDPYTIGAILALSGDGMEVGAACRNGIEMALDELPPELRSKLRVVYEDDQMQPMNTVSAFRKLQATGELDAAIGFASNTSKAIAPLAESARIPLIAIASDPEIAAGRSYAFNLWVTPAEESRVLLEEMKRRGIRRIARVVSIQNGILAMRDAFDRLNEKKDVDVVLDEEFSLEDRDFRSFLLRVRNTKGLDAIHTNLYFGQIGIFARQARELGITLPLVNIETFEDSNEVKTSRGALVGQWYVQADDPAGEFFSRYRQRFPQASSYSAGNCHDAVKLVASALEKGVDRGKINDYLRSVSNFSGAMGVYSATGDNRFSLPATVKVVTKDGFEKLTVAANEQ
ncbi:MAG: ABC transporter substrate-binding protein [Bdellovibrionales bacterium]|nr:ABC transporter substrate-binding protein [Bdellovibrionales bacterium]